ncbi:guanine-1-methyltransferase-domain-containing protein [Limtongia smithiae]|uniref:guanine-1-methyltransferase-domain-containing protein n=1 Tax=Limtongia smithiae TaxID=1125753 RepID=UPI0034CE8793
MTSSVTTPPADEVVCITTPPLGTTATNTPTPADNHSNTTNPKKRKEPPAGLSRNAWKREQKKQRWLEQKDERNRFRREKKKEKKLRRRQREGGEEAEDRDSDDDGKKHAGEILAKQQRDVNTPAPITIILDCAFDDLMTEKEVMSMSLQLTRCYSENRKAEVPVHLRVTSLNKRLLARFEGPMKGHYKSWKGISFSTSDYEVPLVHEGEPNEDAEEMRKRIIYLSSDSSETLTELENNMTYIVGGIVDKGRYKHLCQNKATEQHLRTAKLPISEFIKISGRTVLTTNHVVEIMLKWLALRDWKLAFEQVIPPRKQIGFESSKQRQRRLTEEGCETEEGGDSDEADTEGDKGLVESTNVSAS